MNSRAGDQPATHEGAAIADLSQDPDWNYNRSGGIKNRDGLHGPVPPGRVRRCLTKPVNNEKVEAQGKGENPALFQGCVEEASRKYANLDPDSAQGQVLPRPNLISQSTPDLRRKPQKL